MKNSPLATGIASIIKEFKLPTDFSRRVKEESHGIPNSISSEDLEGRVDLRKEVIVTIDGEKARDFDDAVSVTKTVSGGYCLKVSIADVSHYVRSGSAIDQEAYRRGTSVYFPDRVLPMLPEKLSNDRCSLVPNEDRLTMTAEMEFDTQGHRLSSRFYPSVICSKARLTYTSVRQVLADRDPEVIRRYQAIVPDLERMGELAAKIQERRRDRGSLDFDLPESSIELDLEEGTIEMITKAERSVSHRLIEEFMIAANEAVAEFITDRGFSTIYRVHEEPDPGRVRDFSMLLHNLGLSIALSKKIRPASLAQVIEKVRGKPEERFVNTILLRTMTKAVYSTRDVGHFGLASECYTHFTSPIRRYPDLIIHRLLKRALESRGNRRSGKKGESRHLQQMAHHCSEREQVSAKAEWASRDLAACLFMKDKIGQKFPGIVSGVTKFGFFVELIPYFVGGLVSVKSLNDDYYVFFEKAHTLVGRRHKKKYQIGLPVNVSVRGVNPEKRWIDFGLES